MGEEEEEKKRNPKNIGRENYVIEHVLASTDPLQMPAVHSWRLPLKLDPVVHACRPCFTKDSLHIGFKNTKHRSITSPFVPPAQPGMDVQT